jgi:hypothetical protein
LSVPGAARSAAEPQVDKPDARRLSSSARRSSQQRTSARSVECPTAATGKVRRSRRTTDRHRPTARSRSRTWSTTSRSRTGSPTSAWRRRLKTRAAPARGAWSPSSTGSSAAVGPRRSTACGTGSRPRSCRARWAR